LFASSCRTSVRQPEWVTELMREYWARGTGGAASKSFRLRALGDQGFRLRASRRTPLRRSAGIVSSPSRTSLRMLRPDAARGRKRMARPKPKARPRARRPRVFSVSGSHVRRCQARP
jgi:hypothetical protein